MKQAIIPIYTFTPAAKTVDLSAIVSFDVKKLTAIINITQNQIIYAIGKSTYGLQSISGSVITLIYDTTAMSSTDKLMVLYDQAVDVNVLTTVLATNAATESTLALIKAKTDNIDVALSTRTKPADVQSMSGTIIANAGTNLNTSALSLETTQAEINAKLIATAVGIKVDAESQLLDFSSANLAVAATYTSQWFDTTLYGAGANLFFLTNQTCTYTFEISPDQTILTTMDTATVLANIKFQETQYVPTRYWRIKLTNSGAATTTSLFLASGSRKIPFPESFKLSDRNNNDLSLSTTTTTTTTNAIPTSEKPNLAVTYQATFSGAVTATTPTDVFTIAGAAGRKVIIKHLYVYGEQTTAGSLKVNLIKRSTLNTGGTSTILTSVPVDSSQAASIATLRAYTINPTLGIAVGTLATRFVRLNTAGSVPAPLEFNSNNKFRDITLNSGTELLALNFNSTSIAGNNMAIYIVWTEE